MQLESRFAQHWQKLSPALTQERVMTLFQSFSYASLSLSSYQRFGVFGLLGGVSFS
jgi:hypothetical protein